MANCVTVDWPHLQRLAKYAAATKWSAYDATVSDGTAAATASTVEETTDNETSPTPTSAPDPPEAARAIAWELWPWWIAKVASSWRTQNLPQRDEHARQIAANMAAFLIEKKALGKYGDWQARNREKSFKDWMSICTARATKDYVRRLWTRMGPPATELEGKDEPAVRPPYTNKVLGAELEALADKVLSPLQRKVLVLHLLGHSNESIAAQLNLTTEQVEDLLRAAKAKLRRWGRR